MKEEEQNNQLHSSSHVLPHASSKYLLSCSRKEEIQEVNCLSELAMVQYQLWTSTF